VVTVTGDVNLYRNGHLGSICIDITDISPTREDVKNSLIAECLQ